MTQYYQLGGKTYTEAEILAMPTPGFGGGTTRGAGATGSWSAPAPTFTIPIQPIFSSPPEPQPTATTQDVINALVPAPDVSSYVPMKTASAQDVIDVFNAYNAVPLTTENIQAAAGTAVGQVLQSPGVGYVIEPAYAVTEEKIVARERELQTMAKEKPFDYFKTYAMSALEEGPFAAAGIGVETIFQPAISAFIRKESLGEAGARERRRVAERTLNIKTPREVAWNWALQTSEAVLGGYLFGGIGAAASEWSPIAGKAAGWGMTAIGIGGAGLAIGEPILRGEYEESAKRAGTIGAALPLMGEGAKIGERYGLPLYPARLQIPTSTGELSTVWEGVSTFGGRPVVGKTPTGVVLGMPSNTQMKITLSGLSGFMPSGTLETRFARKNLLPLTTETDIIRFENLFDVRKSTLNPPKRVQPEPEFLNVLREHGISEPGIKNTMKWMKEQTGYTITGKAESYAYGSTTAGEAIPRTKHDIDWSFLKDSGLEKATDLAAVLKRTESGIKLSDSQILKGGVKIFDIHGTDTVELGSVPQTIYGFRFREPVVKSGISVMDISQTGTQKFGATFTFQAAPETGRLTFAPEALGAPKYEATLKHVTDSYFVNKYIAEKTGAGAGTLGKLETYKAATIKQFGADIFKDYGKVLAVSSPSASTGSSMSGMFSLPVLSLPSFISTPSKGGASVSSVFGPSESLFPSAPSRGSVSSSYSFKSVMPSLSKILSPSEGASSFSSFSQSLSTPSKSPYPSLSSSISSYPSPPSKSPYPSLSSSISPSPSKRPSPSPYPSPSSKPSKTPSPPLGAWSIYGPGPLQEGRYKAGPHAKRTYRYVPSVIGLMSGQTIKKAPKMVYGGSVGIRYPVARRERPVFRRYEAQPMQQQRSGLDTFKSGFMSTARGVQGFSSGFRDFFGIKKRRRSKR